MMQWLKHAFAIDPPSTAEPSIDQKPIVDQVCRQIVHRRLAAPALAFLEMFRPLNYVGSQAMHFLKPIIYALSDVRAYECMAEFLERRGSADYLCRQIEVFEDENRHNKKDVSRAVRK